MEYEVLSRIWHSGEARYREVGELVTLDHLKPEWIDILVQAGAVAPSNEGKDAQTDLRVTEETHGTDDSGNKL